jgi:hypothetical protein
VELPPSEAGTKAVILVVEEPEQVTVLARTWPVEAWTIEVKDAPATSLTALMLSESLKSIGLTEGPVPVAVPSACGARPLPKAAKMYGWSRDQVSHWRSIAELPTQTNDLRVQMSCACAHFVLEDDQAITESFSVATWQDLGDTVFVGQAGGGLYTASPEGLELHEHPELGGFAAVASYLAPNGTLWLGGTGGDFFSGHLDGAFERAESTPTQGMIQSLAGPRDDSPLEIFAVEEGRDLLRFSGGSWHEINYERAPFAGGGNGQIANVVWLSPGHALASIPDRLSSVEVLADATSVVDSPAEIEAMRYVESVGVVASGRNGGLYTWNASAGWQRMSGQPLGSDIEVIASFRDGFVYAGAGRLGQYDPLDGFCDEVELPSVNDVRVVGVDAAEHLLVLGESVRDRSSLRLSRFRSE